MKIAITEDDRFQRENLTILLSGERDITVLGAFDSAEQTLAALPGLAPDLLLCDLELPAMSGTELIREVKRLFPGVEIMAYTVFEDKATVFRALKAGASGYILKGSSPRQLIEALQELFAGGAPMTAKIARAVIKEFQDSGGDGKEILTARENEILRLLDNGFMYKEIAAQLNISAYTVHTHIKNIYEKLQARGKYEALTLAKKKGIL
jgi:DNA-binding NarL/FixJ family response regulator